MRIPRQPDGPRELRAVRRTGHGDDLAPVAGPVAAPVAPVAPGPPEADQLRARRQHLVGRLRAVGYWQRLVQARVDLAVAGLLYGAPVPPSTCCSAPAGPDAADELQALAAPPDGLDVALLIGPSPHGDGAPGAHLERLRQAAAVLVGRRRVLAEELDEVTTALHRRPAPAGAVETDGMDGADLDPDPSRAAAAVAVSGPVT